MSIDARDAEGRYIREPSHHQTPEHLFEHDWALAMLEGVLAPAARRVPRRRPGRGLRCAEGHPVRGPRSIPQAELAARLGTSEGAVQVAVHRLRKRYRALVREAIAATVADEAEVDGEIRELFAALGS